jgi:hypothetical protein
VTEQPSRYQRSVSGMVGAMVILIVVVFAFVIFRAVVRNDVADPVRAIDYLGVADYAGGQAPYELIVPDPLPEGWIATTAEFTAGPASGWHLGLLTERRRYVGVEQAVDSARALVREHVDAAAVRGEDVTIDGRVWQTWTDDGADTALVAETEGVTTLVVGTIERAELIAFVDSLDLA